MDQSAASLQEPKPEEETGTRTTLRRLLAKLFEGLEREAKLVSANPLIIPKTFADRLSDRVQVILTPSIGGEAFTGEIVKRAVGQQPAQDADGSVREVRAARTARVPSKTN